MSDRIELKRAKKLKGEIIPPPDKSISHRAIILSSISKGRSTVKNVLRAEDTMSTLNAFRKLGVEIEESRVRGGKNEIIIHGKGIHGLKEPEDIIDCGNSGTTIRLLSGILSGNPFLSILTGDSSLRSRPMGRVIKPLREMGAEITARAGDTYPPIVIRGKQLNPIKYNMPIASAQVKSAILLAGLYADGETEIIEPLKSRDHTERMLPSYGAEIKVDGLTIRVQGFKGSRVQGLSPIDIIVPGDFSSAAFFIVAALLVPDSEILIKNVGINPTRTGLLDILKAMGAEIGLANSRDVSGEPVADIHCKSAAGLKAIKITKEQIPALIDEFPILCIAAAQADGITTIRGAEELRVKESDRIKAMASGLRKMGVEVQEFKDGLSIKGNARLKGAVIESYGDHRIAMAFSIAALVAGGTTTINGVSAVNISFPGFYKMLRRISG
ncbi:MAG: 3-phosphoshikimate 1-carboxyvinyltransferase [Thermodesulfovibrionales bacterium]|nr:3-phosphoshikimate 1-carboxyvinyltransferase [Thermodesulfovibrionales bacterium]